MIAEGMEEGGIRVLGAVCDGCGIRAGANAVLAGHKAYARQRLGRYLAGLGWTVDGSPDPDRVLCPECGAREDDQR